LILPHTHEFSINLAKLPQKTILQNPRFNARKSPLWVTATCPSDQNPFIFSCTVYSCCLLFYAVQGFWGSPVVPGRIRLPQKISESTQLSWGYINSSKKELSTASCHETS